MSRLVPWVRTLLYFLAIVLILVVGMYFYLSEMSDRTVHIQRIQWRPSNPAAERFDLSRLQVALDFIEDRLPTSRSLVIVRNGRTVIEKYYWRGAPDRREHLHSLNLPLLQLLAGIALDQGLIRSFDQPLAELLPAAAGELTLADLMTAPVPLLWGDRLPEYWELYYAADRLQRSLDILRQPEPHPVRNHAAALVLGGAIESAAGQSLAAFAAENLFAPLGISTGEEAMPADLLTGFRLTPLDLAKIGLLLLQEGRFDDRIILQKDRVRRLVFDRADASVAKGGLWRERDLSGYRGWIARGEGGQYLAMVPALDLVIATTSVSEFPLPLDSGRETLLDLIADAALQDFDKEKPKADSVGQRNENYFRPNYLFTTEVPPDIVDFFNTFARDIASKDIKRIAGNYSRGYRQVEKTTFFETDRFLSPPRIWQKMFAGGPSDLQSVQVEKIRIENNRAYLRGKLKFDYQNMNEGSVGWFPLDNLIKLKGEWKWLGLSRNTALLDREEYFDAEFPDELTGFLDRCGDAFSGRSGGDTGSCFAAGFRISGSPAVDIRQRIRSVGGDEADLHLTRVEPDDGGYRVEGYLSGTELGDMSLPPGLRIARAAESWAWAGNASD